MAYTNPVYTYSCPDPFVLKYCGEYFCYSTGWAHDGRAFQILHSRNLVDWQRLGGAMDPLPGGSPEYWAPEVICVNGLFYLYYSVGDGIQMRLRAAVAEKPDGPFRDSGKPLTNDEFAIDAHIFEDEDGTRYMFYAKDFLDHTHIGTGIVADRMLDELTLEGKPKPVALPRFDWQVFDPNRLEKGGVRWHTVEGPFVLKHKGKYYQMFSGGNWKNITYGVSYAIADTMDFTEEWTQLEHNENTPLVLRTIPGEVIGPGHNSVVVGPDGRQLYCVYHRWSLDESARLLSIDRLEWIGSRLAVLGPTIGPQEEPTAPSIPGFRTKSAAHHEVPPDESEEKNELVITGPAEISAVLSAGCFLLEVSLASFNEEMSSEFGVRLRADDRIIASMGFQPGKRALAIRTNEKPEIVLSLGPNYRFSAYHLLQIELNGSEIELRLDGRRRWIGKVEEQPSSLSLYSEYGSSGFKGCTVTYGFEDDFWGENLDRESLGWLTPAGAGTGEWKIFDGEMLQTDTHALNCVVVKEHHFTQYELVINARLASADCPDSCYGFYPAFTRSGEGPLIRVEERENQPCLAWYSQQGDGAWRLPDDFDRFKPQQFRFKKCNGQLQVYHEAKSLGSFAVSGDPACAALYVNKAVAGFDLVRLTSTADRRD